MEKRKWLWRRRSIEKTAGETESSGLISSPSEKYSDDQVTSRASPSHEARSPEFVSIAAATSQGVNEGMKCPTQRSLVSNINVCAEEEDLIQQHAKVAEEAVAGWEKAKNEAEALKQRLEECAKQLRQGRDEQEQKIQEAVMIKTRELESINHELETRLLLLRTEPEATEKARPRVDLKALEKENTSLKLELEIRTIERDLSTEAAETASRQHLDSIKRAARVEAECRRLRAITGHRSFFSVDDSKSMAPAASSLSIDSSSQSDRLDPMNEVSWASALMAELDQFKNEKPAAVPKSIVSSSSKMDLMEDFLEMEQLASMSENKSVEPELEGACQRTAELEIARAELEVALAESRTRAEALEIEVKDLRRELGLASEQRQSLEFEVSGMKADARAMSMRIDSLEAEINEQQALKAEITAMGAASSDESKMKQEEVSVAAGKLADCQKTIESLGKQLRSLATLEDFLVENSNLPEFLEAGPELLTPWRRCSDSSSRRMGRGSGSLNEGRKQAASSSSSSGSSFDNGGGETNCNGFGKLFLQSRSVIQGD